MPSCRRARYTLPSTMEVEPPKKSVVRTVLPFTAKLLKVALVKGRVRPPRTVVVERVCGEGALLGVGDDANEIAAGEIVPTTFAFDRCVLPEIPTASLRAHVGRIFVPASRYADAVDPLLWNIPRDVVFGSCNGFPDIASDDISRSWCENWPPQRCLRRRFQGCL